MKQNVDALLKGVGNVVRFGASTVASFTPAPVSNALASVATAALHEIGFEPIQSIQAPPSVSIIEAFELAEKAVEKLEIETAKKYFDIVLASNATENNTLKFKARCRLAVMIGGFETTETPLLNRTEEVDRYLLDIMQMNPSFDEMSYVQLLDGAFACQKANIEKGTALFLTDHAELKFQDFQQMETQWNKWKILARSFNMTSAWFHASSKKRKHADVALPGDKYDKLVSESCDRERLRIKKFYDTGSVEHGFDNGALLSIDVYPMLKPVGATLNTVNVPENIRRAYNVLMGEVARRVGMQKFDAFEKQPFSTEKNENIIKEYAEIYVYLYEANSLAPFPAGEITSRAFLRVKLELNSCDVEFAKNNSQAFIALLKEKTKLYLVEEKNKPEEIAAQIDWLQKTSEFLKHEDLRYTMAAPEFSAAADDIEGHISNKKDVFNASLRRDVEQRVGVAVRASLSLKRDKVNNESKMHKLWLMDFNTADLIPAHKEALTKFLEKIFLNQEVMLGFYSASRDERGQRELALNNCLRDLFTHTSFSNIILLRENTLNDDTKKEIEDILKLPPNIPALKEKLKN